MSVYILRSKQAGRQKLIKTDRFTEWWFKRGMIMATFVVTFVHEQGEDAVRII